MAFSLGEDNDQGMTEMNLIPLIDIMLVLMIIFLVTATVANPSIPLTLPKTTAEMQEQPPEAITVSIDKDNQIAWNGDIVSLDELARRFQEKSQATQKPTIQLRADKDSKYDSTAQVMSRASEAGLADIAFVSEN
ncbi:ExbD/TolR family protein [Acinetobacter populi]|jgi:biopolymer transport protein ExbD|uniref:Biopolymer transporter ExbD n=1 Tax=Acinetobacter populi TaxID=1582270 RepID=A0A1Z9Z2B9_9GAMM|nr:biopolymer transporter ExbD [Acinetobacter populi]MCH4246947.1 biopolymer transporter ExbD [Acinetobacter populi]OUY08604.1 biopolymer transporter ExbD [Acinetobacter populi]